MSDGVLHLLSLVSATAGMCAFALVNDGHWRQLMGAKPQTPTARATGRTAGTGLLALSFALCLTADPVSMALLVWPMLLAVGAALVAAFLTLQARLSPPARPGARSR